MILNTNQAKLYLYSTEILDKQCSSGSLFDLVCDYWVLVLFPLCYRRPLLQYSTIKVGEDILWAIWSYKCESRFPLHLDEPFIYKFWHKTLQLRFLKVCDCLIESFKCSKNLQLCCKPNRSNYSVDFTGIKVPQFGLGGVSLQVSTAEVSDCPHYGGSEIKLISLLYIYLKKPPHSEHFAT